MINLRKMGEAIEKYAVDVMDERNYSHFGMFMRGLFFAVSRVYRNIVQLRHWLYDKGIYRRTPLGCLVVSVGNLTCGGTGKTPVVEVFARTLSKNGRKVAILSRGYKSKDRTFVEKIKAFNKSKRNEVPPRIVSDGENLLLNSSTAGDEPYMLASNLENVIVLVDKDRVKSGKFAIHEYEVDILILDDGFQYLDLKPHINIVLVDSTNPFHNHHVLPRGLLREPIKNIRRADYVFLTKSNGGNHIRHIKRFIEHHNRNAEIIECCHKPKYLEKVFKRGERKPLESLKGKKIAALSGIAVPESFEKFLRDYGAIIVYSKSFADHHNYNQQEIIDFMNSAKRHDAEMILTTEKDAVRMPLLNRRDVPFYFLRVEIDILSGLENFDQCISRICFS
ncbi:MAG TPA: tetraacyldisaccharide 4'-kinase [Victivallales bacterium]|nr:tetraacyldisaccharide 4'-kinase [Victivallales bacterium]